MNWNPELYYELGKMQYSNGQETESMASIQAEFECGHVQSDVYELTLNAHNDSCKEMRSKARDDAPYDRELG